jgi:hypothetical protein
LPGDLGSSAHFLGNLQETRSSRRQSAQDWGLSSSSAARHKGLDYDARYLVLGPSLAEGEVCGRNC